MSPSNISFNRSQMKFSRAELRAEMMELGLTLPQQDFWGCGSQRAFFDVQVFNPYAQSFRSLTLKSAYLYNEQEKRRKYLQ